MRTFVPFEIGLTETTLAGLTNNTIFWDLVQDNEDGDRYPDKRAGNLQGQPNDREDEDIDGVFPGQDDDNDGLPDTNRNFNDVPDYVEPFLMYYVESNDFFYGLDRNNNDDPDVREDDLDPDYPYDADQRGIHLFGQLDLTPQWSLGAGRYDIEQIAGGGAQQVNLRAGDLPARRVGAAAAAVFRKPPAPRQRRYRRRILRAGRTAEAHRYRFSRPSRRQ